jgi:hypothetical protein
VTSFSRVLVWLLVTVMLLQLVLGGWARLRSWLHIKFIGVQRAA